MAETYPDTSVPTGSNGFNIKAGLLRAVRHARRQGKPAPVEQPGWKVEATTLPLSPNEAVTVQTTAMTRRLGMVTSARVILTDIDGSEASMVVDWKVPGKVYENDSSADFLAKLLRATTQLGEVPITDAVSGMATAEEMNPASR